MKSKKDKYEIPDTSNGQKAMVRVRNIWKALYYKNGKLLRRSLETTNEEEAVELRDLFYEHLKKTENATVYQGRSVADKIADRPYLYIYARPPYQFKVKGKVLCESWDEQEVREARDRWLEGSAKCAATGSERNDHE